MTLKSSIVDVPKIAGDADLFEIEKYQNGLINFIQNANTPLTIALQGEWGSGKTSLMNSLQDNLCGSLEVENLKSNNSEFYGIWLNTWQYSLMNGKEETLMSIIASLSMKIGQIAKEMHQTNTDKIASKLKGLLKKAIVASVKYAAEKVSDGGGDIIDSLVNEEQEISIFHLRKELQVTIDLCINDENTINKKKGFIFFIDDLDRIDPPVAVEILELLKNIFDLNHCIFVLAIDYDVVVKGLEPKFGLINEKNEREFRSFFDKIIQMPFSMPVTSYVIDKFLKTNLTAINYFSEEEIKNDAVIETLKKISLWSVGSNPRSLKRLINSLSLIKCINATINTDDTSDNELLEKVINFALVGIQISYPQVYNLLVKNSSFDNWDERVALDLNLASLDEETKEKLSKSEEFNDEWEQVLFRICEKDIHLQKNVLNISRLLNYLVKYCADNQEPNVGEIIGTVISLSSITNIQSNDQPKLDYHRGNLLKNLRQKVVERLREMHPEIKELIQNQGARVQTNAYIKFTKKDWGKWVRLFTHPHNGKIRLQIISDVWFKQTESNFVDDLKRINCFDQFQSLENQMITELNQYDDKVEIYPWNDKEFLGNKEDSKIRYHVFYFYNYVVISSEKDFYSLENIQMIANIISRMYQIIVSCDNIKEKLQ